MRSTRWPFWRSNVRREGELQEGILPECDPHEGRFGGVMFVGKVICRNGLVHGACCVKLFLIDRNISYICIELR